jgi:plasmid stabilization system protein ParE
MTEDKGFVLHPLAARDITEIWEYIAVDRPLAARRVREEKAIQNFFINLWKHVTFCVLG